MEKRVAIAVQRRGKVEQFELAYERLRIGSASHCDVRLGPDEAAPEAVLLEPRDGALWLHALASDPPLRLHGVLMQAPSVVRERARLELGTMALTIELTEVQPGRPASSSRKTTRQVLMLLGVAAAYAYTLAGPRPDSVLAHPLMPAPLFGEDAETSCRQEGAEAARVFAREQLAIADSQRERWPFNLRDGVQAVPSYQQAAACFAAAGDERTARQVRETARALTAKLEEELSAHRVRLEWFLDRHRFGPAAQEVRALRELLADREDPYANWLAAVAHELQTMQTMQAMQDQQE